MPPSGYGINDKKEPTIMTYQFTWSGYLKHAPEAMKSQW